MLITNVKQILRDVGYNSLRARNSRMDCRAMEIMVLTVMETCHFLSYNMDVSSNFQTIHMKHRVCLLEERQFLIVGFYYAAHI
jgi:hypothetical protein